VNGHPVWPAFGPWPHEAVKRILGRHADFMVDQSMEKYSLTFNPGGFLKRLAKPMATAGGVRGDADTRGAAAPATTPISADPPDEDAPDADGV
jgi:hypothetical protein